MLCQDHTGTSADTGFVTFVATKSDKTGRTALDQTRKITSSTSVKKNLSETKNIRRG